jgi:hypothetical protein
MHMTVVPWQICALGVYMSDYFHTLYARLYAEA